MPGRRPASAQSDAVSAEPRAPSDDSARERLDSSGVAGETSATTGEDADPEPGPGDRIGQYELIRELGRGGMGAVFLARDTRLGRRVAIKFLRSDRAELTARFILEARATARCTHENIVVIHEVGQRGRDPFMVLEYLRGESLGDEFKRSGRLAPRRALEVMVPVVRALACAHEHGIVHRDLKPDNIFITESGTIKVLDFGVAKLLDAAHLAPSRDRDPTRPPPIPAQAARAHLLARAGDDIVTATHTEHGVVVGTLPYMSPEQWGADEVDHRSDLWAVGVLLFRLIAGYHPLKARCVEDLAVTRLLDRPMPRAVDACPEIPDVLGRVIDRCLIKRKGARIASAGELLDVIEPLLPARHRALCSDQSPYAGLCSFQESDAHRFFGRADEISMAVARLRDHPMLAVVGPSGAGKSSFVRAGVIPALQQTGTAWRSVVLRPGRRPLEALAHAIAPMLRSSNSAVGELAEHATVASELADRAQLVDRLRTEHGLVGSVLRGRARDRDQKLLVFVDQFEELYTLGASESDRAAFKSCLACAADDAASPLRVVVSVRSDFLDRLSEDVQFVAELELFFLAAPGCQGLRDALVQPAEMAGHGFESAELVDEMVSHLEAAPGSLPLLQFAASRLWELRDRERSLLTEDSYRAIGGIEGALASHADAVIDELPPGERPIVRRLLLRLITPERTRAVVPLAELAGLAGVTPGAGSVGHLIDRLAQARLLVVRTGEGEEAGGALVEIVHESLIHAWPRLGKWLDETSEDAAFLSELRTAARQWDKRGRPVGLLWRGEAADEAGRFSRRHRGVLADLERAYLAAVIAFATRTARRRSAAVIAAICALSALVVAAAVALVSIREAQAEATRQAASARAAEHEVRAQLEALRRANRDRVAAQRAVRKERREVERTSRQLVERGQELELSYTDLAAALAEAERARRRADQEREHARAKESEALALADELRLKQLELEGLLEKERERRREAEKKITIIRSLPVGGDNGAAGERPVPGQEAP